MNTCAVIVAAYDAAEWLPHLVWSFRGQIPHPGWEYELRIGVDGCSSTRAALEDLGHPFWWSEKNVGAYLIRNSLTDLESADAYSTFDADDYMLPHFLTSLLDIVESGRIAGPARVEFRSNGPRIIPFQGGILTFSHNVWTQLGGYRPDRVASDTDFLHRARKLGITASSTSEPVFVRRVHDRNTTSHRLIGLRTQYRKRIKEKHKTLRNNDLLQIELETVDLHFHPGS